jgi:hypothetical protein
LKNQEVAILQEGEINSCGTNGLWVQIGMRKATDNISGEKYREAD